MRGTTSFKVLQEIVAPSHIYKLGYVMGILMYRCMDY